MAVQRAVARRSSKPRVFQMSLAMLKDAASLIPASKYPAIHQAVLDACDGLDGVTRPLCPYPQVATYKGAGSTDDELNFTCRVR